MLKFTYFISCRLYIKCYLYMSTNSLLTHLLLVKMIFLSLESGVVDYENVVLPTRMAIQTQGLRSVTVIVLNSRYVKFSAILKHKKIKEKLYKPC